MIVNSEVAYPSEYLTPSSAPPVEPFIKVWVVGDCGVYPYPRVNPTRPVTRGSGRSGRVIREILRVGSGRHVVSQLHCLYASDDINILSICCPHANTVTNVCRQMMTMMTKT